MTTPELAVGQVWRTDRGENSRELTITGLTDGRVETTNGWGQAEWHEADRFRTVAPRFMGWDGPPGAILPALGAVPFPWPMEIGGKMPLSSGGLVNVWHDGNLIWQGDDESESLSQFEDAAAAVGGDWRVGFEGALSGLVFQRQGPDRWVAVRRLAGFA